MILPFRQHVAKSLLGSLRNRYQKTKPLVQKDPWALEGTKGWGLVSHNRKEVLRRAGKRVSELCRAFPFYA
jgi:hypothetical protein